MKGGSKEEITPSLLEDPVIKKGERFIVLREGDQGVDEVSVEVLECKLFTVPNPRHEQKKRVVLAPCFLKAALLTIDAQIAKHETAWMKHFKENETSQALGQLELASKLFKKSRTFSESEGSEGGKSGAGVFGFQDFEMPETVTFQMFYVHFLDQNRRLDTWLPAANFIKRLKTPSTIGPVATRSKTEIDKEFNHVEESYEEMSARTAVFEKQYAEATKVKTIEVVRFGKLEMDAWYYSPYYPKICENGILFVCQYCLVYTSDFEQYLHHTQHVCHRSEPPGDEIYRYGNLSIYEVCGLANKSYCQCLCLLAKLFLDHKTLTYETDLFLFYILCLVNEDGANILGFFSKERGSANNLACIVVFPPYQRQGYGSLLIQLSYELSRREGVIAGPEYPLSDLGKTSYRKYWINVVCRLIQENCYEAMGISELSFKSGFRPSDIIAAVRAATLKDPHLIQLIRESDQEYVEIERNSFIGKPTRLLLRYEKLLWEPKDIYRTRHVSGVSRSHY